MHHYSVMLTLDLRGDIDHYSVMLTLDLRGDIEVVKCIVVDDWTPSLRITFQL
jgi:hypothetical protein